MLPEKLRGAKQGLSEASRSYQEGISAVQSDEDTLQKSRDALQHMRGLAAACADAANHDVDRKELNLAYTRYKFELSKLGTLRCAGVDPEKAQRPASSAARPEGGSGAASEDMLRVLNDGGLGDIAAVASANEALASIDNALNFVSAAKEKLGGVRSELESAFKNRSATAEKQKGAGSSSAAKTNSMIDGVRKNLLSRSSSASLAQANVMPQGVLRLIG